MHKPMFKTHMSNCFATRNDAAIKLQKQKSRYMPFKPKFGEDHSCIGVEIPKTHVNFDTHHIERRSIAQELIASKCKSSGGQPKQNISRTVA